MKMDIRAVTVDEAPRLTELMRRLFVAAYAESSSPANVQLFLDRVYRVERQAAEIANADIHTRVLEDGEAWAGFVQVRFASATHESVPFAGSAELGRIYLDPHYQGRALGARLLGHAESAARERGRAGLWLNVWQKAPQAIAFYRRQGFDVVGTNDFHVGDDPQLDWVMAKRFDAA